MKVCLSCMDSNSQYLEGVEYFYTMRRWFTKMALPLGVLLQTSALLVPGVTTGLAQTPGTNQPWTYLLLHESFLLDDCPACGRPSIQEPMRGSFSLRLIDANPISARYAVEDILFKAGSRPYRVT